MTRIFINYRKRGGAYAAALLDELLSSRFGEHEVFRAARSIAPGSDYSESILECVADCEILLVIVDEDWAAGFIPEMHDASPKAKGNWVSREIEEAFKNGKIVVPVLLSGAEHLDETILPEVVARVARLQYLRFDYRNIHQDIRLMSEQLVKLCPELKVV